ncbi:hypothetical protein BJ165DRAFT_1516746 [Panaeolus papilionaceus]|nr:hypothetical protein BJ165DRAFT_1516746 [Panaeolus papilionaceus]
MPFSSTSNSDNYNFPNQLHSQSSETGSTHHQYIGVEQAGHPVTYEEFPTQHGFSSIGTNDPISMYPSPVQSTLGAQTRRHVPYRIPHGTPNRKKSQSAERQQDLDRSRDPRFLHVVSEVVNIMTEVEVPMDGPIPQQLLQEKFQKLSQYLKFISDSDGELRQWLQRFRDNVGTLAGRDIALNKRKTGEDSRLFICLWCSQTLTVKNNLGNHVRSHLKFPLSFCDHCDFSSVTPRLPTRHLKIHKKQENSVPRREKTPYNLLLPASNLSFLGSCTGAPNWV